MDGTGRIRYTEFLAATIEAQGAISEERLAEAFDRLDCDDSGFISADNLVELLGKDFPRDEIDSIINEADLTKDNKISYSEFLTLWENKHEMDRNEQLNLLGQRNHNESDFDMCSFRGSSLSLAGDYKAEIESAGARASFIIEKHVDTKHVDFAGTVVEITQSNTVDQKLLSDNDLLDSIGISIPYLNHKATNLTSEK